MLLCYKSFKYCACQHYRSRDDTDAQRSDCLRSGRYTKSKPFSATVSANLQDEKVDGLPPPTPISKLQQIGNELGIVDDLLTVEKLMVDPSATPKNGANV